MARLLITREDERRIDKKFDEIISALEKSELVINRDFFDDMSQKIERRNILQREKEEQLKEYLLRQKEHHKNCMRGYMAGFLDAELLRKYPDMFDGISYPQQFYITDCIAEFIVEFFTENREDHDARIERRIYNRWYAKNIRRAKDREDIQNANKNAT